MPIYITFYFHMCGTLVSNRGVLKYIDGKVETMPPVDVDLVNYFDLVALFKKFGYHDFKNMFWMHLNSGNLDTGLRLIVGDQHITETREAAMCKGQEKNNIEMHLYFEHPILDVLEDNLGNSMHRDLVLESLSASDDYDSAEDSLYRPNPLSETDDDSESVVEELPKKQKYGLKGKGKNKRKVPISESEIDDDVEEASFEAGGYASYSEHLRTPDSTDDEGISKPTFPVFNESTVFGQVNLALGMKFANLELFKNAVKDYNIHLGRQFKWKKMIRNGLGQCARLKTVAGWCIVHGTLRTRLIGLKHLCKSTPAAGSLRTRQPPVIGFPRNWSKGS